MSKSKHLEIGQHDVLFINQFKPTCVGFSHTSYFYVDGTLQSEAKLNYINRTWESYTYQSAMMSAVHNAMDQLKKRLINEYKQKHGFKRMTQQRQAAFDTLFATHPATILYTKTLEALR